MPRKRAHGKRSSAWIRRRKRLAIYARDGWACVWCGARWGAESLDHLWPRGHRYRDNDARWLVSACSPCNSARKRTPVAVWLRHLRARGRDVAAIVARLRRRTAPLLYDVEPPYLDPAPERAYAGPCDAHGVPM